MIAHSLTDLFITSSKDLINMVQDKNNVSEEQSVALASLNENGGDYSVLIPCPLKNFGEFVSKLLGNKQVLSGEIFGSFDVGHNQISNIYHLVKQRVENQNEGTLSHFSITVYYDNGDSIIHNNINSFINYHPTENCYPVEVVFTFVYIIVFPASNVPEKQTVEVALASELHGRRQGRTRYYGSGLFEYSIEYTDRTWASDIAGLLKNYGNTILEREHKVKDFLIKNSDEVISYTCVIAFLATTIIWAFNSTSMLNAYSKETNSSELLLLISKYFINSFCVLVCLGLVLYIIKQFSEYLIIPQGSFIILVDQDSRRKERILKRRKSRWIANIFAWLLSVVASVVASYIYASIII
jgi:hypothetical protein